MKTLAPDKLVAFGPRGKVLGTVRTTAWAQAKGLVVEPGVSVVESPDTGCLFFVKVKDGQTVSRWGLDCPVVEVFNVDTVPVPSTDAEGNESFALWGVLGQPAKFGTTRFFTRPENLVTVG